jgi:hypothetical protein
MTPMGIIVEKARQFRFRTAEQERTCADRTEGLSDLLVCPPIATWDRGDRFKNALLKFMRRLRDARALHPADGEVLQEVEP